MGQLQLHELQKKNTHISSIKNVYTKHKIEMIVLNR